MSNKRVFHHYERCEEFEGGMWRKTSADEREQYIAATADLMRDITAFTTAMRRAIHEWPMSCEHNLTCSSINHRAWLGHAGNCIATGSPEELTRLGWHRLTQVEQDAANAAADIVLDEWRAEYVKHNHVGTLFDMRPYDAQA